MKTREEEIKQKAVQLAEDYFCDVDALIEMALWADEHPKNQWINVKDGLPDFHTPVYIKERGKTVIAVLTDRRGWYNIKERREAIGSIDKWMQIELPKESEK